MIAECNADDVAGVIIFGTELKQENSPLLDGIRKPLVIYDAAPDIEKYPVILIDNRQGSRTCGERTSGERKYRYSVSV